MIVEEIFPAADQSAGRIRRYDTGSGSFRHRRQGSLQVGYFLLRSVGQRLAGSVELQFGDLRKQLLAFEIRAALPVENAMNRAVRVLMFVDAVGDRVPAIFRGEGRR
ncbi:MAG TPA: hypothetical protein VGC55_10650 [Dokdonella sp.]